MEEQRELAKLIKDSGGKKLEQVGQVIPDELSSLSETVNMKFRPDAKIETIIKEGQEIIVQVAKEPISTKGPRVTRLITLPGRYVVFMPFIEHIGVSRRIELEPERDRLRTILESIRPEGKGVIARTVADGQSHKTLKSDFNMLVKIWHDFEKTIKKFKAPHLCYQDLPFVHRVLRDIADEDIEAIRVDQKELLKEVDKFTSKFLPGLKGKGFLYDDEVPLFEKYGVDMELERGLTNKIFLRSGGSLNIDQTEALVSIDVNTGKFVGRKNLEDTILKTNLEAVKEIAYQLRLRNCGGIIIIDFIDMERVENREAVYSLLLEALKKDRAKTSVLPISAIGIVEMTRKRTRDTLTRIMGSQCPYCEGTGRVKSIVTVCYELIRELFKVLNKFSGQKVHIFAHPEVSARLCDSDLDIINWVDENLSKSLIIRSENNYHIEQYEIFPQDN